jgi:hypothetical protein
MTQCVVYNTRQSISCCEDYLMTTSDPQTTQPTAGPTYVPPLNNAPYPPAGVPAGYHVPSEAAPRHGRGKILVLGVLATVLLIQLAVAGLTMLRAGPAGMGSTLVRIVISLVLSGYLYRGREWARLIMAVLLIVGALVAIVGGLQVLQLGAVGWTIFAMGAVYGACAAILLFSRSVREFLSLQWSRG